MRIVAVALALAVAFLAACGANGDERSAADAYREAANRICARASRAEDFLSSDVHGRRDAVRAYRGAVTLGVERVRQLRKLEPPDELREDHLRMVREFELQNEILERELIPRLDAGVDPQRAWVRAQVRAANANNGADFAARRAGVLECSLEAG
jgi:hypothetical protein